MSDKINTDDLLQQSQEWAGWEKHLCKSCKETIKQKMLPIQRAYNSKSKYKQMWAKARMASLTTTLWRHLCHQCIRKIRKQAGV